VWLLPLAASCEQTRPDCGFVLTATPAAIAAAGGTGGAVVTPAPGTPGCSWSIRSDATWLSLSGTTSGSRQTSLSYVAAVNASTAVRSGNLILDWTDGGTSGSTAQQVTQAGVVGAAPSLNPGSQNVPAGGATFTVNVSTTGSWAATVANAPWLTITSGATGNGDGTISLRADANTGGARAGTLLVTGLGGSATLTVSQSAVNASLSLNPSTVTVGSGGQSGLTSQVASNVVWTASSDVSWLSITSGAAGNGNGTITFSAAANGGSSRSGTITVTSSGASATLTVNQSGVSNDLTVAPLAPPAIGSAGQSGLTLTVTSNVAWAATVSSGAASWLSITNGSSGTGSGTITYAVAANSGAARSGTITVAGSGLTQTVTVNQSAFAASISVNPATVTPDARAAGNQTVSVSANVAWTASVTTAGATWLTLNGTSGGPGTNNLSYSVALNPSAARSATITLTGSGATATLTVNQGSGVVAASFSNTRTDGATSLPDPNANCILSGAAPIKALCNFTASVSNPNLVSGYQWQILNDSDAVIVDNAGTGSTLSEPSLGNVCGFAQNANTPMKVRLIVTTISGITAPGPVTNRYLFYRPGGC
jgi:hypothetical protein